MNTWQGKGLPGKSKPFDSAGTGHGCAQKVWDIKVIRMVYEHHVPRIKKMKEAWCQQRRVLFRTNMGWQ